jgi:glycopeptide antibiotics resistance protein
VILILLATRAFFFLREKFRDTWCRKTGILLLFLLWIGVILFGTLGHRTEGSNLSAPILTPFASYLAAFNGGNKEIFRTNFMNVMLFYPAGLLGCEILPEKWKRFWKVVLIALVFALGSLGIECIQYRLGLGLAEADDVIHNTLGVLLGAIAWGGSVKENRWLNCQCKS